MMSPVLIARKRLDTSVGCRSEVVLLFRMENFLSVRSKASVGLASGEPRAGGESDGATGKFAFARGMPEGQGKFFIAAEAPPAIRRKKRGGQGRGQDDSNPR